MKALVLLLLLLLAVMILLNPGNWQSPGILVKIGKEELSSTDLSYRIGIEKAYGKDNITQDAAVVSFVNDAIEHEISRANGINVTSWDIATFSDHIDNTTRAPEILDRVKQVFGNDRAAYERIYIEPKIINVKLRSWYSHDARIHQGEKALIEKAYYLARSGKSMEEAAQETGLPFSTIEPGKNNGFLTPQLEEFFPDSERPQNDPMISILETLSDGMIYQNIVEDDQGYKVIKLVHKNDSHYIMEAITSSKRSFTEWFLENATSIHIEIFDMEMKNMIVSKYQSVWWVEKMKK